MSRNSFNISFPAAEPLHPRAGVPAHSRSLVKFVAILLVEDAGNIAILICYDVEFPEVARVMAEAGAEILFVPSCTDGREGFCRVRYCAQARAIENQVYVAMTGTVGNLPTGASSATILSNLKSKYTTTSAAQLRAGRAATPRLGNVPSNVMRLPDTR